MTRMGLLLLQDRDKFVSFDTRDQSDDTFYAVTSWCRYVNATDDGQMEADFYPLLANYSLHYFTAGARSLGFGGTPASPNIGGGVPYWNESLNLLWNPNLEHSRLGSYWSAYGALANALAAESFRCLAESATRLQRPATELQMWESLRAAVLLGIDQALTFSGEAETGGDKIYAELRGHPNDFSEDRGEVSFSPLLWGMSWVNIAPVVLGLSSASSAVLLGRTRTSQGRADHDNADDALHAVVGLDAARMDATFRTYRRRGSFQWVNADPATTALVPTTHVNASAFTRPPPQTPDPSPCLLYTSPSPRDRG